MLTVLDREFEKTTRLFFTADVGVPFSCYLKYYFDLCILVRQVTLS